MNVRAPWLGFFALIVALAGCATPPPAARPELRLQTGRYGHAVATDGRQLYVVGGSGPEGLLGDIEVLDPRSGRTEVLAAGLIPRRYHSAVLVGRRIVVVGGQSATGPEPAVEIFDLKTKTVALGAPLPTPRRLSKAALLDGSIYVVGGQNPRNPFAETGTGIVEAYDVAKNEWRPIPALPTPRECAVVVAQGRLWALGGFDGDEAALAAVETYDPKTGQWTRAPDLPFRTSAHSALATRGALFTFGDYRMLDRVARLDLRQGIWTELDVPYVASRHNACAELRGEIFVVGGNVASSGSHLDLVQRFAVRDLRAAPPRTRTGTEWRGFGEPTAFAGMLKANPRTVKAADRTDSAVQTVVLQQAGEEIVRDSKATFQLHLDRLPLLVRVTAEVWHAGTAREPQLIVNGDAVDDLQFAWPSLRERNYVAFLWDGDGQVEAAYDYQGWLPAAAFIDGDRLRLGDNEIAIEVGLDQIKVRNVKAELLFAFDEADTIYDQRRLMRDQPNPLLPADK
ncbi:MAG: Kelch repeat-containing protein [Kiritimatiellia bacterium]